MSPQPTLGQKLTPLVPFLRRYARALTGAQASGDSFVRATLQAIVAAPDLFPSNIDPRLALYRQFQEVWAASQNPGAQPICGHAASSEAVVAQARLAVVTPLSRRALLLSALEGFTNDDIAFLVDVPRNAVDGLIRDALDAIDGQTRTQVLIIEDEPIIAMDIEAIVRELGHSVTGIAVTRDEAVAQARQMSPGLVLADIQLADDSSGIDAVSDILTEITVPVIFITAFPERLLTGERHEPTFLITKPFQQAALRAAIAQALFFNPATVPA